MEQGGPHHIFPPRRRDASAAALPHLWILKLEVEKEDGWMAGRINIYGGGREETEAALPRRIKVVSLVHCKRVHIPDRDLGQILTKDDTNLKVK